MTTTTLTTTNHQAVSPWTGLPIPDIDPKAVEQALTIGDLAKMSNEVRIAYYLAVCQSAGLNPLTRPFTALKGEDGRVFLYANKDCAEQLRKVNRVSLRIISRERLDDLYVVTVRGWTPDGREDEAQGVVSVGKNTAGLGFANLLMRAETKGKRRVTFSLCGLGFPVAEDATGSKEVPLDLTTGTLRGETAPEGLEAEPVDAVQAQRNIADMFDRSSGDPREEGCETAVPQPPDNEPDDVAITF